MTRTLTRHHRFTWDYCETFELVRVRIRKERGETVKNFVPVTVFRRATRSWPRVGNGSQTGGILLPIKTIATSEAFQRETWPEELPTPYSVKIRFCWPLIGILGACSLLSTNKCIEVTTGVFLYPPFRLWY